MNVQEANKTQTHRQDWHKKNLAIITITRFYKIEWLPHQDSNLKRLHQKQMCYHYTMGQKRVQR